MYSKTKKSRHISQNRVIATVITALAISIASFTEPAEKSKTVFAADSSKPSINTESVMTSASVYENASENNGQNSIRQVKTSMQTQIISSACIISDTNSTKAEKENTSEDAIKNRHASTMIHYDSDLNMYSGTCEGPSGKETYYNLPMDGVVRIMRSMGYSEEEYPYWIRDDGVNMFGDYVMVAANLDIRPKGTILECSLGPAIVVDTGDFAKENHTQLDIATSW